MLSTTFRPWQLYLAALQAKGGNAVSGKSPTAAAENVGGGPAASTGEAREAFLSTGLFPMP